LSLLVDGAPPLVSFTAHAPLDTPSSDSSLLIKSFTVWAPFESLFLGDHQNTGPAHLLSVSLFPADNLFFQFFFLFERIFSPAFFFSTLLLSKLRVFFFSPPPTLHHLVASRSHSIPPSLPGVQYVVDAPLPVSGFDSGGEFPCPAQWNLLVPSSFGTSLISSWNCPCDEIKEEIVSVYPHDPLRPRGKIETFSSTLPKPPLMGHLLPGGCLPDTPLEGRQSGLIPKT